MPVRILEWQPVAGRDLPDPLLQDDRESFPVDVVRRVVDWLTAGQLELQAKATTPEPIIIALGDAQSAGGIRFDTPASKIQAITFTHGRIEVHMKDTKTKMILASYAYLCAMSSDGRHIVGPQLAIRRRSSIQ